MDPIESIHYENDTTLAMLWEAQKRGWQIYYFEQHNLFMRDGVPFGEGRLLTVFEDSDRWFQFDKMHALPLSELNVIFMRKDPPFNESYIYTTYLLEYAESLGVKVINRPQGLRDCNEKFFISAFPTCTPPTLIAQSINQLRAFLHEYQDIVCKPLNGKGGALVFHLKEGDDNANVVFDFLTHSETCLIMAQKFIPEIKAGDKRIILINGEPIPHMLVRLPHVNDWRGNLAAGATGVVKPLSPQEISISKQVGPTLRERGLYFVGLDVIGNYLTEINITSPTCIREIDRAVGSNICAQLLDVIEKLL